MAASFRLTVEDALALALAISDKVDKPSTVVLPSTGQTLPIIISGNGCRRVDVITDDSRPHGWMKLMEQNPSKGSATAARARAGARIVHILPLDPRGGHTSGAGWGMVENGKLAKNSTAAVDQSSFKAYKKALSKRRAEDAPVAAAVEQPAPKRTKREPMAAVARAGAGAGAGAGAESDGRLETENQRLQAIVSAPLVDQLRRLAGQHGVDAVKSTLQSLIVPERDV